MSTTGYIYILIRSDFIEKKQYIYKIGETTRYPPHRRLWEYPYGSVFLSLFKVHSPVKIEKLFKKKLSESKILINRADIGVEYYEGELKDIIDILVNIYPAYQQPDTILKELELPLSIEHLLKLNRIHYMVNYKDNIPYFSKILGCQLYSTFENNKIPSELIYKSYQTARQWNTAKYPDNYVIRCGGG